MRRLTLAILVLALVSGACVAARPQGPAGAADASGPGPASPAPSDGVGPDSSFPGQIGTPFPTVNYLPVVSAEPAGSKLHVHFDGLVFDMPATWHIRQASVDEYGIKVDAFVGTAPSIAGCFGIAFQSPAVGATSCSYDLRLGPGDVSIALEIGGGGPMRLAPIGDPTTLGPGHRVVTVDGVPAVRNDHVTTVPGAQRAARMDVQDVSSVQQSWTLEAGVRDPGSDQLLAEVADVFASVHYATRPVLPDTSQASERKVLATALGQLRTDDPGYACFPAQPGGTATATMSVLPGFGTPGTPIAVTCRTDLAPLGGFWTLTLTVTWGDAKHGAGSSVASMVILSDGTANFVSGFSNPLP
jgi:hypothetical protein